MKPIARPNPLTLSVLLAIYLIWISAIVSIITIPSLSFLGVLAAALVLFIWLPYWARVNWHVVSADLSATYATMVIALILIALLGFLFSDYANSIGRHLVQAGWLEPHQTGLLKWFQPVVTMCVFFSIFPAWRWLRRAFTRKRPEATDAAIG